MKATRKSVTRARASGAMLVALALMVPLSTQAQPEPVKKEKPAAATPGQPGQAQPAKGQPAKGQPPQAQGPARAEAPAPSGPAAPSRVPGKAPGSERAAAPERAGARPTGVPVPAKSPEAEARRAELEKRRRERTIASYNKAFEDLHPPFGAKGLSKDEKKKAKRQFESAKRRIVAMHRMDAKRYQAMDKATREAIEAKVDAFTKKLETDRKERAEKERTFIKASLGDKVTAKPVHIELRQHAWRIARLNYLLAMAEARENTQAVEQAKMLIKKEDERHKKALALLKTMKLPEKDKDEEKKDKKPSPKSDAASPKAAATEKKGGE